jgi:hypothetical protein
VGGGDVETQGETNESTPNTQTDTHTHTHTSAETSVDAGKGTEQGAVRGGGGPGGMDVGKLEEVLGAFKAHWRLDWITAAAFLKVCEFVHICVHLYNICVHLYTYTLKPLLCYNMYICEYVLETTVLHVWICVNTYLSRSMTRVRALPLPFPLSPSPSCPHSRRSNEMKTHGK